MLSLCDGMEWLPQRIRMPMRIQCYVSSFVSLCFLELTRRYVTAIKGISIQFNYTLSSSDRRFSLRISSNERSDTKYVAKVQRVFSSALLQLVFERRSRFPLTDGSFFPPANKFHSSDAAVAASSQWNAINFVLSFLCKRKTKHILPDTVLLSLYMSLPHKWCRFFVRFYISFWPMPPKFGNSFRLARILNASRVINRRKEIKSRSSYIWLPKAKEKALIDEGDYILTISNPFSGNGLN